MRVADLNKFVKGMPGLEHDKKALRICFKLLEILKETFQAPAFLQRWRLERDALDGDNRGLFEHVSSLIARQAPIVSVLRLICLECAVEGGLDAKRLAAIRRELLQSYGFDTLVQPLFQLERCGLLYSREGSAGPWPDLRKTLGLTVEGDASVNVADPTDIHYVAGEYAPLSVRLVQAAVGAGGGTFSVAVPGPSSVTGSPWEGPGPISDLLRSLPGPTLHLLQTLRADLRERCSAAAASDDAAEGGRKVVLVVYVGGVSHIELSALRFLSERLPFDFLVLTTGVINGNELVSTAMSERSVSVAAMEDPAGSRLPTSASNSRVAQSEMASSASGSSGSSVSSSSRVALPVTPAKSVGGNPFGAAVSKNPFM